MNRSETKTIHGFTWERDSRPAAVAGATEPIWKLMWEFGTSFVLKNYGERPDNPAFDGTRLVSGGPFTDAGRWKCVDDAMNDRHLAEYLREHILRERDDLQARLDNLNLQIGIVDDDLAR